ncbi:MAG TPA: ribonuclease catalytic domain-containing protein [Myxococcota bacterium]|nr:ribonuclease catalytic domain-containing protein [Myxococcota bacterium]
MGTADAGRVVLGVFDSGPAAGVVLDERAGRFTVLTADGVQATWSGDRVFFKSAVKVPAYPLQSAVGGLAAFTERLRAMVGSADLAGAWELLSDAGSVTGLELAELLFSTSDPAALAAAAWVIESDGTYFRRRKDGSYQPAQAQTVESAIRARQRDEQERARMTTVLAAVRTAMDSTPDSGDSALASGIGWLQSLVYDGPDGRDGKRGIELVSLLRGAPASDPDVCAFDYLVRLNAADPDEILSIRRNRIPLVFEAAVEAAAIDVANKASICGGPPLQWAAGSGPLAIDDETTRDVDDALMAEPVPGGTRVHVIVADPGAVIDLHGPVGTAGMERASSLYLPAMTVPMFPKSLSEAALSLSAEGDRPMIDFAVTVAPDGTVLDSSIGMFRGRLEARVTYDEADDILAGSGNRPVWAGTLESLDALAVVLRTRRIADGAVMLDRDEYSVKVVDGRPMVRHLPRTSRSRRLVAEFMILAGAVAGRFARQNGIPVVYRRQDPPDGDVTERLKGLPAGSRALSYTMLRTLKRGELTTIPGFHYSLGVVGYTQVTSPLRRFQDFLAHLQIKGFLKDGVAPMDQDKLMAVFGELEARSELVTRVEREARRYWTLKYLQTFTGSRVDGEVVSRIGARVLVELSDTGLVLPLSGAGNIQPGSPITVVVREVDPRRDHVTLNVA